MQLRRGEAAREPFRETSEDECFVLLPNFDSVVLVQFGTAGLGEEK